MRANIRTVFFALIVGTILVSCRRYSFSDSFDKYTALYFGTDIAAAKAATISFIHETELKENDARKDHNVNYDNAIARAWLRLACIYRAENDASRYKEALSKAINCYDRIPNFAADSKYVSDKEGRLFEFLSLFDRMPDPPKWQKDFKEALSKK